MRLIDRLLVRAPLLAVGDAGLGASPLGGLALRLASPSLAAGLARGDAGAEAACARYGVRAGFRATPHGLLAGVGVGRLGTETRVATGAPAPHLTVSWARLAAAARALLDDEDARAEVRVRVAPSLLRHGDHAMWLGPDGDALEATVDEVLAPALAAAARWTRLGEVAAAAGSDELVLDLLDDGLLCSELTPPLVGPPPLQALRARLRRLRAPAARALAATLDRAAELLAAAPPRPDEVEVLLGAPGLHATLVFPRAEVTLARAAVERAAALAPLLVRLAAALAPPTAERDLDPGLAAAVDAAVESFGPGALALGPLALGGYGVRPDDATAPPARPAPPPALLALLVDRLVAAAAAGAAEVALTAAELDAVLPPAPVPPTVELSLAPRREPAGARPGTGWLLGWHAPAGATWGRFAHALPALGEALAELAAAEPPGRLDVAFAPDAALADLATHPPLRPAALALSSWPAGRAVTPADLALVGPALALQGGTPAPLARLRSTMAPAGVYQLLVGWSLHRQHAPWALALGPLADLAVVQRVVLDGFVIAPASFRLPPGRDAAALAAWRAAHRVPRHVQVGHEDELLPVDLDDPAAPATLAGHERVLEIWPPLDEAPLDVSGRRVEAVVAVVLDEAPVAPAPRRRVPPPTEAGPEPGWQTFLLFGPRDRQERLLTSALAPAIADARARGELDAWFFLRYVDGVRHHLRVRVRGDGRRFERRLARALAPALAAGDLITQATAPFHAERARYGAALTAVLGAAEASSDLTLALLALDAELDLDPLLVRVLDALARGLGLAAAAREELAGTLRAAVQPEPPGAADVYRRHARGLRAALGGRPGDEAAPLLEAHARALAPHRRARAAAADLCHLALNRLAGIDAEREALAYIAWQRTLEGLRASRRP